VIAQGIPIPAVITIVMVFGLTAAWIFRHSEMKASLPIVTFALVLALGIGVTTHDRTQAENTERDGKRAVAVKAHDDCVQRVERSIGNRSMWLDLGTVLEDSGKPDAAALIHQLLDKNLPALSIADCPEAPL
jgi:hypothetical protein